MYGFTAPFASNNAADGSRSYRASGVNYMGLPELRRKLAETAYMRRNFNDAQGSYWEISNQIDRKMEAIKRYLGNQIRDAVARQATKTASTQTATPRSSRGSRSTVAESLNPDYSGDSPRSMVRKGKGRSTALADVYKPSLELREDEIATRRIGSLTGSSGSTRQSGATMLSRFGANKDNGRGFWGASASRVRGLKELTSRPDTWMARFLPYYIAAQVSKGMQEWRDWDKVSWTMSEAEAKRVMKPRSMEKLGRVIAAAPVKMVHSLMGATVPIGAMMATGGNEAEAAAATDYFKAWGEWIGGGFEGSNPSALAASAPAGAAAAADHLKAKALQKAEDKWKRMVMEGVARYKDTLAVRGVGGVFDVAGRVRNTDTAQAVLGDMKMAARASVDYNQVLKDYLNGKIKDWKD